MKPTYTQVRFFTPLILLSFGLYVLSYPSVVWPAEVAIDWSSVLKDPVLQVVSYEAKTVYWISGTLVESSNEKRHKYILPDEVRGLCFFSVYGGTHAPLYEYHEDLIVRAANQKLQITFPDTAAIFEIKILNDLFKVKRKLITVFRMLPNSREIDPFFYTFAQLVPKDDSTKRFGMFFAVPATYVVCVSLEGEAAVMEGRRLFQKTIIVTGDMLTNRTKAEPNANLLQVGHIIPIELSEKDEFKGAVGVVPLPLPPFVFKSVSAQGLIKTVTTPDEK